MMKWWGQSYLVGIPTIVCGFRDNEGVVHSLKTFNVENLPTIGQVYSFHIAIFFFFMLRLIYHDENTNLLIQVTVVSR